MSWEQRFLDKIIKSENSNDCWDWNGYKDNIGRGRFRIGSSSDGTRRKELAHRVSYGYFTGDIPEGMHVLHKCDNPSCVNPKHLFLGDHADNMEDMAKKLRSGRAKLTPDDVREIRKRWNDGESQYSIAKDFPVNTASIWRAANGEDWRHIK